MDCGQKSKSTKEKQKTFTGLMSNLNIRFLYPLEATSFRHRHLPVSMKTERLQTVRCNKSTRNQT